MTISEFKELLAELTKDLSKVDEENTLIFFENNCMSYGREWYEVSNLVVHSYPTTGERKLVIS